MNKNKCVKKKLSKKNKIKNKHKTNKFLYKIHGGSNISAILTKTPKNNAIQTTLQTLIKNPNIARVIIMFKGLKIQCKIGKQQIEFKKGDARDACITLKYDFVNTKAKLDNFFYYKNKKKCISSNRNINNTEYIKTHTTPPTYNKDLNKLLLTLIDIINIDLQMTHCVVGDAAFITCINEITMSLDIKHYARGYGFIMNSDIYILTTTTKTQK